MINFIILAAGRGSRLKKTTKNIPKGLVEINKGQSILDFQIKILKKYKESRIYLVVGYKSKKIINHFKEQNLLYIKNKLWNKSNMFYSLMCADKLLKKNVFIILYSDIIYSKKIIDKMILEKSKLSIAYDINWLNLWKKRFKKPELDAESFYVDKTNIIKEIGGNINKNDIKKINGQYMGIIKIYPKAWSLIKKNFTNKESKKLHLTHVFNRIINKGLLKIKGVKNIYPWYEIDNNKDLKIAKLNMKNKNVN